MIQWSDNCLSCLANLPHSLAQHWQAVNEAAEELHQELEDFRVEHRDLLEDETDTGQTSVKLSSASVNTLIALLQQSYHGY